MELWELIAQLCKAVVDNQNVYLSILITDSGWSVQLIPTDYTDDDDWEEEEDE
jgi:hypothetical protein